MYYNIDEDKFTFEEFGKEISKRTRTYNKANSLDFDTPSFCSAPLPANLWRVFYFQLRFTSLPHDLPEGLRVLVCIQPRLTALPDKLPSGLQILTCYQSPLAALPEELPDTLKELICYSNKLKRLPTKLPQTLLILIFWIEHVQMHINYCHKHCLIMLMHFIINYNK